MSIEVHIDSITLDILSRRLKNTVTPMGILNWLNNFEKEETEIAIDFLKRFTVYTSNEIEEIFHEKLNLVFRKLQKSECMIVHPIGTFGKSGSMMSYLLKKTNIYKINSERIKLCPNSILLKNYDKTTHKTLVLIDDFIGSGKSVIDYWNSDLNEIRDYYENIFFIGIAGMELGINNIEPLFDDIIIPKSNIYKKAFSSDASFFGYRNQHQHREIAYKYGCKLTKPRRLKSKKFKYDNALGFENSQSLVGFFYGCPNNTLPIFWQDSNSDFKWASLLPRFSQDKISKAKDFRKSISFELSLLQEFGTDRLQREFVTYEVIRGKKIFESVNHIDFSLYAILKLTREGYNDFNICQKLGILHSDYLEYLKLGKRKGIFNSKYEISLKGLELYSDAKKCIKNSFAFKFENKNDFNDNQINYIPKTFNGKS